MFDVQQNNRTRVLAGNLSPVKWKADYTPGDDSVCLFDLLPTSLTALDLSSNQLGEAVIDFFPTMRKLALQRARVADVFCTRQANRCPRCRTSTWPTTSWCVCCAVQCAQRARFAVDWPFQEHR